MSVPDPEVPPSIQALRAYELQDAAGVVWTIQIAVGVLPADLLRSGDVVDVAMTRTRKSASFPMPPAGGLAIHLEDDRPLVLINSSSARVPVEFEPGEPECGASDCVKPCAWNQELTLRATLGDESVLIGVGETAELGGMRFRKAHVAQATCLCIDLNSNTTSLVGGYAIR